MERISRQIQQLGLGQRSALIWCVMLALLFLGYCVALVLVAHHIRTDIEEMVNHSYPEWLDREYIYVIQLNESWAGPRPRDYKYENHTTTSSV